MKYRPDKFFKGKKYVPDNVAKHVLEFYTLFHDGNELYNYDQKGVWILIHVNELGKFVTEVLDLL